MSEASEAMEADYNISAKGMKEIVQHAIDSLEDHPELEGTRIKEFIDKEAMQCAAHAELNTHLTYTLYSLGLFERYAEALSEEIEEEHRLYRHGLRH